MTHCALRHTLRQTLLLAMVVFVKSSTGHAQSLDETFNWMVNTLEPSEHNNRVFHRPTPHSQYPPDWIKTDLDPYHEETITKFSHVGCRVRFEIDIDDNDMGFLLGKHFVMHAIDTFDLKDIDLNSIRIENSCAPFETITGPATVWNCDDEQGKFLTLRTFNAEPKIHEESTGSSWKSGYRPKDGGKLKDELCKAQPDNGAYCDQPERKNQPRDMTSIQIGFSTPDYARRFVKALKHAAALCGARQSTF